MFMRHALKSIQKHINLYFNKKENYGRQYNCINWQTVSK